MNEELRQQLDSALNDLKASDGGWAAIGKEAARRKRLPLRCGILCAAGAVVVCALVFALRSGITPAPRSSSSASMIAMVAIDGKWYEQVKTVTDKPALDEQIATVEYRYSEQDRGVASKKVTSTVLSAGTAVYSYGGYNPDFRVCGQEQGQWCIFQRSIREGLPDAPVVELLDIRGLVKAIVLTDNEPREIGRIDDPATVSQLTDLLLSQGSFVRNEEGFGNITHRLKLLLKDGTQVEGPYQDGNAWLVSWVQLPAQFADALSALNAHSAGMPLNAMGGGLTVGYDQANELPGLIIDVADGNTLYACWWGWMGEWLPVDAGPVRDVQMEGNTIWFIAADNTIHRLKADLRDFNEFGELMDTDGSLVDRVHADGVIAGSYRHIRVWHDSLITLDEGGVLARDGEVLARGVVWMDVDSDGILYVDAGAAYRWEGGASRRIADGSFTAIGSMGHSALLADAGGIRRVSYGQQQSRVLSQRVASKLIYDGAGGVWFVEEGTQALYFIDTYGDEQLIRSEGVLDFGLISEGLALTTERRPDGTVTMYRITMPQPGGDLLSREYLLGWVAAR